METEQAVTEAERARVNREAAIELFALVKKRKRYGKKHKNFAEVEIKRASFGSNLFLSKLKTETDEKMLLMRFPALNFVVCYKFSTTLLRSPRQVFTVLTAGM